MPHVGGIALRQLVERGADRARGRNGVGAGREKDRERSGGRAIEAAERVGGLRAELHSRHVFDPDQRPVGIGAHHDVLELFCGGEAPKRIERQLPLLLRFGRLGADPAQRGLGVLLLHRLDHIARNHREAGQPVGVEPDPHAVVQGGEQLRLADARHAGDRVENVDRHVIVEEERVAGLVRRVELDHLKDRRGALADRQSLLIDFRRQLGLGEIDPVLDVDRVDVRIAADLEADGQRIAAVIAAGRSHVDRFVDAVDLRLDRLRNA